MLVVAILYDGVFFGGVDFVSAVSDFVARDAGNYAAAVHSSFDDLVSAVTEIIDADLI